MATETSGLLNLDESSFSLVDAIGSQPQNMWAAPYSIPLGGEIVIHDVLLHILEFVEAHLPTLLSVSSVCCSWRERSQWLPQWNAFMSRVPPKPHFSAIWRSMGLPCKNGAFVVHSRDAFVQGVLAMHAAAVALEDEQLDDRKSNRWVAVKWLFSLICFMCIHVSALLALSFALGYAPNTALDSDVKVGAAVWCTCVPLYVIPAAGFLLYVANQKELDCTFGLRWTVRHCAGGFFACGAVSAAISTVIVALLGARINALTQLRAMPVLAVVCNEDMARVAAAGAMPGRVLVPDAAQFEVVSAAAQSALDAAVWYVIVNATSPALCAAGEAVSLAVSLRGNTPLSEVPWPPRALANGSSAYFATAPDVRYFAGNPEGARDRAWYRSALWTERGIPLIAPEPVPPVATKLAQYVRALAWVVASSLALTTVPVVAVMGTTTFAEIYIVALVYLCVLLLSPATMIVFGGVCGFAEREMCMISRENAIGLFTCGWSLLVLAAIKIAKR